MNRARPSVRRHHTRKLAILPALLALTGCQGGETAPAAAATDSLRALTEALARQDSATAVLQQWCTEHGLMPPADHVRAVKQPAPAPPAAATAHLHPSAGHEIVVRNVRLMCGPHTVSTAILAYLPERLTPEMNRQLAETDRPFGKAVSPLHFRRQRLPGDSLAVSADGQPPASAQTVLINRALLTEDDGGPFAFVEEHYQRVLIEPDALSSQ